MAQVRDSGFVSISDSIPQRDRPQDWLVWHFTHLDNLPGIVESGSLRCQTHQNPIVSVALQSVKERRLSKIVDPDDFYPVGKSVADHVPFYIAVKSPMLYAVTKGHLNYAGGDEDLIFLGLTIGAIVESEVTWCASDSNAASNFVEFSREVETLGSFVDFDLLCQKWWNKTPEDQDRPSRRAAEVLILDEVPLTMITHVVTKTEASMGKGRALLDRDKVARMYRVVPELYYS